MALTVGSLFSGIGGIDLGLERAGMDTRWFVEIDPHCRNVLRRHWPGVPVYGDITTVDWGAAEPVDVLAGGFPCQPVSNAGKRLGTADERWLWPAFAEAIRVLRPRYVLVENVAALRYRGLGIVLSDLAALGYDAEWDGIPASAVGAAHQRDRLWLVAYPGGSRRWQDAGGSSSDEASAIGRSSMVADEPNGDGERNRTGYVADAQRQRPQLRATTAKRSRRPASRRDDADPNGVEHEGRPSADRRSVAQILSADADSQRGLVPAGRIFTAEQEPGSHRPPGRLADGEWWATEPDVGRVADGVPHRVDRLRSLGNAVVPQVVEWIGRRIVAFDEGREVSAA